MNRRRDDASVLLREALRLEAEDYVVARAVEVEVKEADLIALLRQNKGERC